MEDDSDEIILHKSKTKKGVRVNTNTHPLMRIILIVMITAAAVLVIAKKKPELLGLTQNPQQQAQIEIDKLTKEVGKIYELPTDETPTLATVDDLDKVKQQDFFSKAQVGDKILIYTGAKKAILYRPSENKIIEIGVVNLPNPTGEVSGESTEKSVTETPETNSEKSTPAAKTILITPVETTTP